MKENDEMDLLGTIRRTFSSRVKPERTVAHNPDTDIYEDAMQFSGLNWEETNCQIWESLSSALYGFSPEAFCYFVPGVMKASIVEKNPDLLVAESLIDMLDRMPRSDYRDDFFIERWPNFSAEECRAIESWIYWLFENSAICEVSAIRASDTLALIRNGQEATHP